MKNDLSELLNEIDSLLATTQQFNMNQKVDRLMESAADSVSQSYARLVCKDEACECWSLSQEDLWDFGINKFEPMWNIETQPLSDGQVRFIGATFTKGAPTTGMYVWPELYEGLL